MISKAKKSDFVADFVTDPRYLEPLLNLLQLERGKFYAVRSEIGAHDCPNEAMLVAWLIDTEESQFRSLLFLDPGDLWTGYAQVNYSSCLEMRRSGCN